MCVSYSVCAQSILSEVRYFDKQLLTILNKTNILNLYLVYGFYMRVCVFVCEYFNISYLNRRGGISIKINTFVFAVFASGSGIVILF
jgi:hypothetical protein